MHVTNEFTHILERQHRSARNTQMVLDVVARKGCGCVPYETVFTYGDWQSLGYQVQKGEKSICRVLTFITDKDTGQRRPHFAYLFCFCQVRRIE